MTPKTQEAFDNILDTCGGADSGKFVSWMMGMEQLDKEGSEKSKLVIDIMVRFSNLLNVLHKAGRENNDLSSKM